MATFYIEAIEATNIALVKVGSPTIGTVKYGINDNTCPNTYTVTTSSTPISLIAGQKCYWTITNTTTNFANSKYLKFTSTGRINVGGNLSDLIGGNTAIPRNYCFYGLFYQCTTLVDASNLVMVSEFDSKSSCYNSMFYGCTSLTKPPELPATTLATTCYQQMFYGCTSLIAAPELPATTLANYCYDAMFRDCTSLTTAPELPATTLAEYCYMNMFYGCTSLKLSDTQTGRYTIPYRIPKEGTGTSATGARSSTFSGTGGTFTGTPAINTTYYLWKGFDNVQLYDSEIKLYPVTSYENLIGNKPIYTAEEVGAIPTSQKGAADGVASLDANGKIPTSQLPIYDGSVT